MTYAEALVKQQTPASPALLDFVSVLVVEDERFDRHRLRRMCEALDMSINVIEADTLSAMRAALTHNRFDLVILDYTLADGNGFEAIEALRGDEKNSGAATIMVTGSDQFETAIEALRGGCSDYILKDELNNETLYRAILNSREKSALKMGLASEEAVRKRCEAILERFSRECAQEVKPMLSRMMRQLREFSACLDTVSEQAIEHRVGIERSCLRLWEFLETLEAYRGSDLAVRSVSDGPNGKVAPQAVPKPAGQG